MRGFHAQIVAMGLVFLLIFIRLVHLALCEHVPCCDHTLNGLV
jgi:hypothetical protein